MTTRGTPTPLSEIFWRVVGVTAVFGLGFGAGRDFSNESAWIMVIPAGFAVLALVARAAVAMSQEPAKAEGSTPTPGERIDLGSDH